jgi:hypothetical protein
VPSPSTEPANLPITKLRTDGDRGLEAQKFGFDTHVTQASLWCGTKSSSRREQPNDSLAPPKQQLGRHEQHQRRKEKRDPVGPSKACHVSMNAPNAAEGKTCFA